MALSLEEKENVLVFTEASKEYQIYCSSPTEKTRMTKAGFVPYKTDKEGNCWYRVKRNQISFRKESEGRKSGSKREMSEEHKEKLRQGRERRKKSETVKED